MTKKDNRQSGFGFGDFELFADESAEMVQAPVVEPAYPDFPHKELFDDEAGTPCPGGCEHSESEHIAFDTGVKAGEDGADSDDCPFKDDGMREAWMSGHSVGAMNRDADEPALCVHYSDDCPVCEDDAAIAAEGARFRIYYGSIPVFNEADCGGVFDGFGVVSDADPGL